MSEAQKRIRKIEVQLRALTDELYDLVAPTGVELIQVKETVRSLDCGFAMSVMAEKDRLFIARDVLDQREARS